MAREADDHLATVGDIVAGLKALELSPVLIGGMALVVLGSRRVTRDFDFLLRHPGDVIGRLVALFYDRQLELASRLDAAGNVTATIAGRKVASIRLRLDAPSSAYFYNVDTGLRVDLLFDYPVPAVDVAQRAVPTKIRSQVIDIASEADLLRLKLLAKSARAAPGDAEDVAFLQSRLKQSPR